MKVFTFKRPSVLDEPIPETDLVVGAWYLGDGRCKGAIAMWHGAFFHGFNFKWGRYQEVQMEYHRGFTPYTRLDLTEE